MTIQSLCGQGANLQPVFFQAALFPSNVVDSVFTCSACTSMPRYCCEKTNATRAKRRLGYQPLDIIGTICLLVMHFAQCDLREDSFCLLVVDQCVHTHKYIHTYTRIHAYRLTHTDTQTHTHIYIYVYIITFLVIVAISLRQVTTKLKSQ